MNNDKSPATDMVNMYGAVTIYQEDDDGNRTYICKDNQNHFTKHMVKHLCGHFCSNYVCGYDVSIFGGTTYCGTSVYAIMMGTDTTTITDSNIDDLISKIDTSATLTTIGSLDISDESNGNISLNFTATWVKNTISGNIGEIGLYFRSFYKTTVGAYYQNETIPVHLVSRFSVADGSFEAFDIDTTKNLIINYKLGVSYE